MQIVESTPYQNFLYALKSKDVKRQYPIMLARFFDFTNIDGIDLEAKCKIFYNFAKKLENRQAIESELMRYIHFHENRVKKKEIASGTLRNYVKAIKMFFTMNDILVNWSKIKMGMSTAVQTSNDRIPEISEIQKLLGYPDIRLKPIVLTMLSSGIRVGSWDWLKWKHVIPIKNNDVLVAAKIVVYEREPEQYFSFITPEAYNSLKEYMDFRTSFGEKITGESWLIRDQWQKIDKKHGHRLGSAEKPHKLDAEGIRRLIYDAWKIQGVLVVNHNESANSEKHQPFKSSHGFRKFFQTFCEQVMKAEDVEILMGHGSSKRGLKANYYRPKEDYLLNQYLKAIDLLTVNEENKLKSKINELTEKEKVQEYIINKKLMEKDQEIEILKKNDKKKEDAISALSEQLMKVISEVNAIKK